MFIDNRFVSHIYDRHLPLIDVEMVYIKQENTKMSIVLPA